MILAAYVASIFPHGGALIYGSQEVGYPEPINFFKYVAVDWMAKPEIYQEYKKLISLYNDHAALRKGNMKAWPADDVLIFEKSLDGDRFLVMVSVRNSENAASIPAEWTEGEHQDLMTGKPVELSDTITLEPFRYCILKK